MVVFDSSFLMVLLDPQSKTPAEVSCCRERLAGLVAKLDKEKIKIIVPTPVLAEVLVYAKEAAPEYLGILGKTSKFIIADFDQRSAIECAIAKREAMEKGDKKSGLKTANAVVNFDRQIVAIALVNQADIVYSSDEHLFKLCRDAGIQVQSFADLPIPPQDSQTEFVGL